MLGHPVPAYLFIYCGLFTSFAIEQCHSSKERETKEDDYWYSVIMSTTANPK